MVQAVTQTLSGRAGFFFIAPQSIQANTGASAYVGNSLIHAYVTAGSAVNFAFDRTSPSGDSSYGYVTISGYLVDSPVPAEVQRVPRGGPFPPFPPSDTPLAQ